MRRALLLAGCAALLAGEGRAQTVNLGFGTYNATAPTLLSGQIAPLQLDGAGNLKVNVVAGVSGGGSSGSGVTASTGSASSSAVPVQDAASGKPLGLDSSLQSILTKLSTVNVATQPPLPAGTNAIGTVAVTVAPTPFLPPTATDAAATITAANTYQIALAANPSRHSCTIISKVTNTDPLQLFFGAGTATAAASAPLAPGQQATCQSADEVQITGPTTGDAFVVISQ